MEDIVAPVVETSKAITEYGILVVIAAIMLLCMFILFKHFLKMFDDMFQKMNAERSIETTMEQIRVLQSVVFDLAKYQYLEHLQRIFDENHLEDKESVKQKVHDVVVMMYNDRKSKFDNFRYHGYALSYFCDDVWMKRMENIGMKHLYARPGDFDANIVFNALNLAYNQIKIEFYNNVISKS